MRKSFAEVVLKYLEDIDGFTLDVSTRNPIERISFKVSSGQITPIDALEKVRAQSTLYRLNKSQYKGLEDCVRKIV
ncbi:MAG: hypothetical protein IPN70_05290 [Candidatus Moraniibacteriota bacterium]|nr:MAG: hypothetical protein IPN70_05290 [Candidatus Moranbacteria bacterium]